MTEGPCDALDSIEKSLQSMNDLDIHPSSSQLLLLNGRMAYHLLFVDCYFSVFIKPPMDGSGTKFDTVIVILDVITLAKFLWR